jgi:hypothetical protein
MAMTAGYPLFERPWIGATAQHLQIVIRFENQKVEVSQSRPGQLAPRTEVGNQAESVTPPVLDHDPDRLACIVRNRKRLDCEVADLDALSRRQNMHLKVCSIQVELFKSTFRGIDGNFVSACKSGYATSVIRVLVGNDKTVEVATIETDQG